jgi:hypothetical protein
VFVQTIEAAPRITVDLQLSCPAQVRLVDADNICLDCLDDDQSQIVI